MGSRPRRYAFLTAFLARHIIRYSSTIVISQIKLAYTHKSRSSTPSPPFSAVDAEPFPCWYPIIELLVTVNMTTVEIAFVAYKQYMLIFSRPTLVANIMIILRLKGELFLLNRYSLSLFHMTVWCVSRHF